MDVTTPLPSLPDGALSTVYHTTATAATSSTAAPAAPSSSRGKQQRRRRRRRDGRRRQIRVQDGASHRYTVRERVALFLSLWPYTVPLVCVCLLFCFFLGFGMVLVLGVRTRMASAPYYPLTPPNKHHHWYRQSTDHRVFFRVCNAKWRVGGHRHSRRGLREGPQALLLLQVGGRDGIVGWV